MEGESGEQVGGEFVSVTSSGGCFVQVWRSLVSSTQLTSTSTSTQGPSTSTSTSTQSSSTSTSTSTSGPSTSTSTKRKSLALRHTAQNKRCCSLVYGQTSNKKYSLIN